LGIKRDAPVEPLCAGNGTRHEKDVRMSWVSVLPD
jgi:hypothetical protein